MNYTTHKLVNFEDFPEDVKKDFEIVFTNNYSRDSDSVIKFTINLDYLNNFDGWYNVAKMNISNFLIEKGFELGEVIYIHGIY